MPIAFLHFLFQLEQFPVCCLESLTLDSHIIPLRRIEPCFIILTVQKPPAQIGILDEDRPRQPGGGDPAGKISLRS